MGSISIKEFGKKTSVTNKKYTFIDLYLDIKQTDTSISNNNTIRTINGKDIEISPDEAAIANSIFNILNTRPGQRFLIPTFGCNLYGYIGLPVTDSIGRQIGQTVYNAIRIWEPRVTIDDVLVVGKPDQNEYDITLTVTIPTLKKKDIKLIGTLTSNGILEARLS
jgi:phage baseplate assembly protein W